MNFQAELLQTKWGTHSTKGGLGTNLEGTIPYEDASVDATSFPVVRGWVLSYHTRYTALYLRLPTTCRLKSRLLLLLRIRKIWIYFESAKSAQKRTITY